MTDVFRLFTNVSAVQLPALPSLILDCRAVLLESPSMMATQEERRGSPRLGRIRGFYTDAALPVFRLDIGCGQLDYTIELRHNHYLLSFGDGTQMTLFRDDTEQALNETDFADYAACWQALALNVLKYSHAPNFPVAAYLPREMVTAYVTREHGAAKGSLDFHIGRVRNALSVLERRERGE